MTWIRDECQVESLELMVILNSEQCWCPAESQKNQKQYTYLQIDLGRVLTFKVLKCKATPLMVEAGVKL